MRGTPEKRETAYKAYAASEGEDIKVLLRRLRDEHGIMISATTFYKWKREGDWLQRAAREKSGLRYGETMLLRLNKLIEKFERRMDKDEDVEPQAVYAYVNAVRAAVTLSEKYPHRADPEKMKRVAEEILEREYGIKRG
ncbi:MAG: hypothetical protein Q8J64_06770 [Thermodesulfovibrionales bacterium]|nr:hypothetical protein [Thermodesulfovibrionales bacterium]